MNLLRSVLLGLAACVLVLLAWRLAPSPSAPAAPPSAAMRSGVPAAGSSAGQLAAARKLVESRLADVPQFAGFYQRLAAELPRAYARIVDGFASRLAESGTLAPPDPMFVETLRSLQQEQGILAAQARGQTLAEFFDARRAVLDALAPVDARQCADFLYGAADLPLSDFATTHRDLIAQLADKQLAAIKDGQDRHEARAVPTPADIDLVASGLAARKLTPDEVALLLDGKTLNPPLPDSRLCDIGRIYLSVLQTLPNDARERVYGLAAELLARS